MSTSSHDRQGHLRPLRQRNPFVYWVTMVIVVAMLASVFAAVASVL